MVRQPIVAGNWKMHGSPESIKQLLNEFQSQDLNGLACQVIVCPPALFIDQVVSQVSGKVAVGAQNASEYQQGAYTGEISPEMIKALGCEFSIIGHSERRQLFHETSEQVAQKAKALLEVGVTPILCVGESLQQREAGNTVAVVQQQLSAVVSLCGIEAFADMIIAYEPIWAIGTGKTASPEQAQQVHQAIRDWLKQQDAEIANKVRILYGGSVKANNAAELFSQADIDGGLIGGASLKAQDFYQICKSAG